MFAAVMYIWDLRKTATVLPDTFFLVKTRSQTQDNNENEKEEDLFSSKSPELLSRILTLPNLVMIRISHLLSLRISSLRTQALYRDRLDQVKAVCRKYGLGNRQNIIEHEKANAWTFNETRFNNDTRVETRFYERMLESASRLIEKSLMHLEKNLLLYCWIHKVRTINQFTLT